MKHIVCVHHHGAYTVGDERRVSDAEWLTLSELLSGPYKCWFLRRDLGSDTPPEVSEAEQKPELEPELQTPPGENTTVVSPGRKLAPRK
jgi:hypothetical protein